jgi:hypothetical protein
MTMLHAVHPVSAPASSDPAGLWPPTGRQQARKPDGGFLNDPLPAFTLPWWGFRQGQLSLEALRAWFGTLELVERRCRVAPGTPVHYTCAELQHLLQAPRRAPVARAVARLEEVGLLTWTPEAVQVLPHPEVLQACDPAGYAAMRAALPRGLRWVPVPRRLLVWLAQAGQPGLIATACGVLLRCMRYKARQCVAGGRVAAPWIAAVFGVAERTVQRAFTTLEACGWLARLAGQPARERPHGRYTVINFRWQRPGAAAWPRHARHAAPPPEEPAPGSCRNLSPLEGVACHNLSPLPAQDVSISPTNTGTCGATPAPALSESFQEERHDPEPAGRGPTGASTREGQDREPLPALLPALEDEEVTDDAYAAAVAQLVAQGTAPAFCIRPVVLAEVQRMRQLAVPSPAAALGQAPEGPAAPETPPAPAVPLPAPQSPLTAPGQAPEMPPAPETLPAPAPCLPTPQAPLAPRTPVPACARPPTRTPAPTLRDVTLADLSDVDRLLALHQQAIARGWLRGGEAARLNVVAAAVHARRVGQAPCRLFVALLRDQRWEVITQEDEDQARRLLREHRDGPLRRHTAEACAPVPDAALSDDARFALRAEQVLRQAGWTRERWDAAQATLAQWRLRQAAEAEADLERCEADET